MTTHSQPAIVVGIDGSSPSMAALRWAAQAAEARRAPLRLIYAVGAPIDYGPGISVVAFDNQAMRADGEAMLRTAEKTAREAVTHPDELDIDTVVADPPPIPVLIDRSKDALTMVVGTHGYGAVGRALLGSVSSALVRHAHCPVAVIPEADGADVAERVGRPVVVGVDGSAEGALAIDIAFDEASRAAASVWSPSRCGRSSSATFPVTRWPSRPVRSSRRASRAAPSDIPTSMWSAWWSKTGRPGGCCERPTRRSL